MTRLWLRLLLAATVSVSALLPASGFANMANPHQPGDPLGEPYGGLEAVTIVHEQLAIDMRPLRSDSPALVDVTYRVRNDGPARTLDLQFVAASLAAGEANVSLDDAPIPSQRTVADVPASWRPPATTPPIGSGQPLSYETRKNQSLAFALSLDSGEHRIQVRYPAVASAVSGDSPTRYWQLGYVLAPAREWAGFGGLDITVQLPAGWHAAATPALQRTGDTLSGSFLGVPADALALTTQAPAPAVTDLTPFAWLGGLIVSIVLGIVAGRWLGAHGHTAAWALPVSAAAGIAWFVAALAAALSTSPTLAGQDAWTYHYGQTLAGVLLSPLALVAGLVVTQLSAVISRRRAARR